MVNMEPKSSDTSKRSLIGKRKAVQSSAAEWVKTGLVQPEQQLPLVITPAIDEINLVEWARGNIQEIERQLLAHGAILFRGFAASGIDLLTAFISATSGELLEYTDRSSPRSEIGRNIYTSTDHPADQAIFLHNENSYSSTWPLRIFFFCVTPAQQGGATPLADCRRIYQSIDPSIRATFAAKQVIYVRNFGDGLGLSWQTTFQTTDRDEVDAFCQRAGIKTEWKVGNRLRTIQLRRAVARHPRSGEMVWFNQVPLFHISMLDPLLRTTLLTEFEQEDLPLNVYYGDGSPIEPEVVEHLCAVYQQETTTFAWQQGDLLMVDNMLVAHGREPFVGPRKVLVGMSNSVQASQV
jgi:alpha-ketoglutarate-dependent taurine dioxygenase